MVTFHIDEFCNQVKHFLDCSEKLLLMINENKYIKKIYIYIFKLKYF